MIASWDVADMSSVYWRNREACWQWVKEHISESTYIYKIEFYDGFARVFRLHLRNGQPHLTETHTTEPHDHDACEVAKDEPFDVPLRLLPPADLLGVS